MDHRLWSVTGRGVCRGMGCRPRMELAHSLAFLLADLQRRLETDILREQVAVLLNEGIATADRGGGHLHRLRGRGCATVGDKR
jgi:hypothetical protein